MKWLDTIWSVVIYERGKFCWRVEQRMKTLEDYKRSDRLLMLVSLVLLLSLLE